MTEALIILGVIVLSFALRTMQWAFFRKMGVAGFLVATFLVGFFLSGKNLWIGAASAAMWFVFPWVELLTRTRNMRLPLKRVLAKQAPPGSGRFPELQTMTEEIEAQGFEYLNDTGWQWDETQQFFRFFYHEEKRTQAAICFTEQGSFSWACINLTSRHQDGRIFRSINIPFSIPMKTAPNVKIRRDMESADFPEYLEAHDSWLLTQGVNENDLSAQDDTDLFAQTEEESGQQIRYNLDSGIIALCKKKRDTWKYSWRGLMYLYFQVVKDFVRWC